MQIENNVLRVWQAINVTEKHIFYMIYLFLLPFLLKLLSLPLHRLNPFKPLLDISDLNVPNI